MHRQIIIGFLIYSVLAGAAVLFTYRWSFETETRNIATTGQVRLEQATGRLRGQLQTYRVLVNALARDPRVVAALQGDEASVRISTTLRNQALTYGVAAIDLITSERIRVGSADPQAGPKVKDETPLIRAALNGRLGVDYVVRADGQRFARFARGVSGPTRGKAGAVILWVNLAELEFEWPVVPETIFFVSDGRVISASRWDVVVNLPLKLGATRDTMTITQDVPQLDLTAYGRFDTRVARSAARMQALLVFLLTSLAGLVVFALLQQRQRLASEAAANATLEARVEDRTRALRAAQDQLVQASKLTALGQMSAGVSHELNQPLAAILAYAQNGQILLDRGRTDDANENLTQIETQIHRINRMISVLRTFARNEAVPKEPTNVTMAVNAAIAMVQGQIQSAQIDLTRTGDWSEHFALAGRVRLEQVFLNLLSNAVDALSDVADPRIDIDIRSDRGNLVICICDNGSGIANPERVFEPFYTTKDLGASKGLGLGLALSFGIIESFDGRIRCDNAPTGGAVFEVELPEFHETKRTDH